MARAMVFGARAVSAALLGALALTGALVLGPTTGPAQAADSGLSFSEDGASWSQTAPASLFPTPPPAPPAGDASRPRPPQSGLLVPGGSRTTTIWVRNDYAEPVTFSAEIVDAGAPNGAAASAFGIAVHDGDGGGLDRTDFGALGDPHPALAPRALAIGESVRIDVTVDLSPAATDRTMDQSVVFALRVKIVGTVEVTIPSEGGTAGGSIAVLSNTGEDGGTMLVAIGAGIAMGATGWLLMGIARRRRRRA